MSANDKQISGTHYKQFKDFEPWDVALAWGMGYLDGTALKYIARWRHKNGIEDLRKAIHYLEKLIEVELANPHTRSVEQRVNLLRSYYPLVDESLTARLHPASTASESCGFTRDVDVTDTLNTIAILRPDEC